MAIGSVKGSMRGKQSGGGLVESGLPNRAATSEIRIICLKTNRDLL